MPLEVISFILGGGLIVVGLIGGGITVRDFRVPPIGSVARMASFVAGLAFVGLALYLSSPNGKPPGGLDEPARPIATKTFAEPMFGGYRLDACYAGVTRCEQETATEWCKSQGYVKATQFEMDNVGARGIQTKQIGSQIVCSAPYCGSFKYITCEK